MLKLLNFFKYLLKAEKNYYRSGLKKPLENYMIESAE